MRKPLIILIPIQDKLKNEMKVALEGLIIAKEIRISMVKMMKQAREGEGTRKSHKLI